MHQNQELKSLKLSKAETLLKSLRNKKIPIPFSCNGAGICTTCRIIILKGEFSPPTEIESERIQERNFTSNERLACQCTPLSEECEVLIP